MPRVSDSSQKEELHCNFMIPREVYRKFRILSAEKALTMKELYRRAASEFVEREMQQQQAR